MTRIGRDSTTARDIPVTGTQMAMGYINGLYAWSREDYQRFPNAGHVSIDVNGSRPDADVLDVENEDATPAGAVDWVRKKLALNGTFLPVLYVNRGNVTDVFNHLLAAGYHINKHFKIWIATLDGKTKTVPDMTGVVAVQWADTSHTGGHFDESVIYDDSWKPAQAPPPPPPPVVRRTAVKLVVSFSDGSSESLDLTK